MRPEGKFDDMNVFDGLGDEQRLLANGNFVFAVHLRKCSLLLLLHWTNQKKILWFHDLESI